MLYLYRYDEHKWIIRVDLKAVNFLLVNKEDIKNIPVSCDYGLDKHSIQKFFSSQNKANWENIINQQLIEREKPFFLPFTSN